MTQALTITITQLGLERFTAAQLSDDIDLSIAAVGLTDAAFVVAPTLTALPGEFRRLNAISGEQVGDNLVHMTMRDEEAIGYFARGFGLFLDDGTLFAVYGQPDRIFEKSPRSTFLAAIDIAFPTGDVRELTFGNTDFLNPPATTTTKGVVELATLAEADAGTDPARVAPVSVMAAIIKAAVDVIRGRRITGAGMITGGGDLTQDRVLRLDAATNEETRDGIRGDVVVTPLTLRVADFVRITDRDHSPEGYRVGYDGFKDCWGTVDVPAGATVAVPFPVDHVEWATVIGCVLNEQDAGIVTIAELIVPAAGAAPTGFRVRNVKTVPASFSWQSKGV